MSFPSLNFTGLWLSLMLQTIKLTNNQVPLISPQSSLQPADPLKPHYSHSHTHTHTNARTHKEPSYDCRLVIKQDKCSSPGSLWITATTWQLRVMETIFIAVLLLFHLTQNLLLLLLCQLLTLLPTPCYTNTVTCGASPYSSDSSAGALKSQCQLHVKV